MIDDRIWIRHSITYWWRNSDGRECTWSCQWADQFKYDWIHDNEWDADSLDRFIRQNSYYLLKIDEGDNKSATKRFEYGCSHDLSVFDIDCLKGIERLEIGNDCFEKVNRFEIDGLNELETIIIRQNCFFLGNNNREGSKCVIMNCDHLKVIHTGRDSFYWYESLELKNLPSLIFIQLDDNAFTECHSVVFESMNNWMNDEWDLPRLQFITLGRGTLFGDKDTVKSNLLIMRSMNNWKNDEWDLIQSMANGTFDGDSFMIEWNELIMKSMNNSDGWLIRSSFSISIQRRRPEFPGYRQSDIGE